MDGDMRQLCTSDRRMSVSRGLTHIDVMTLNEPLLP